MSRTTAALVGVPAGAGAGAMPAVDSLSEQDRSVIQTAAMQVAAAASSVDPGFLPRVTEALAGSRAVRTASPEIKALFEGLHAIPVPQLGVPELVTQSLTRVQHAAGILKAKAPGLLDGYCRTVVDGARDIAVAAGGLTARERAFLAQVERVLQGRSQVTPE